MTNNQKERLVQILYSFGIVNEGITSTEGATVTLYKIKPVLGTKLSKIRNLKDEIAYGLSIPSVRVIAPMPDGTVGIEVPNSERSIIPMDDILSSSEYENSTMELPLAIGQHTTGETFIADLTTMPHLLVAGATGQGKSVGLNMMLMSLLHKLSPEELRLILIDPKQVELGVYNSIANSYLASPVITDVEQAGNALVSVANLMEQRYTTLQMAGVRNIQDYNRKNADGTRMPYIVVVIDEYGDLVMQAGKQMERVICRIAQKARAVGIHMIISTQRPSATIVTGDIKANFPTRIAFRTVTGTDSRVILDQNGAEKLTGKGDMLFFCGADVTRIQCAYASMNDVENTLNDIKRKYSSIDVEPLFKPKEYKLDEPPLYNLKKHAIFIATNFGGGSYGSLMHWFGIYNLKKAYNQLIQLGIIAEVGQGNFRVICNDADEIARRIDNCQS